MRMQYMRPPRAAVIVYSVRVWRPSLPEFLMAILDGGNGIK